MKRLYAFKTIQQILRLIDKSAGYSDMEKRRALDLALENNFVTSLTSLVVTGQEDPVVVATSRELSHDERRHQTPTLTSGHWPVALPDDGVGGTSISINFASIPNNGNGIFGGKGVFLSDKISGLSGSSFPGIKRRRPTKRLTTTTTPAPRASVSGCKVVVYASTYYRGQAVEIMGDVRDLRSLSFSDKLASLKVEGSCRWEIFQGKSQKRI